MSVNLLYGIIIAEYLAISGYHLFQREYAKAGYWFCAAGITLSVRLM